MRLTLKSAAPLAVSVIMVAQMVLPVWAAQFVDTSGHWAQQSIESLTRQGVLSGYPGGQFRPEGTISRAEFATMLVKALGMEGRFIDNGSNFVDVPRDFWGYRAIEIVSDNGLVSGYPGGYYRPNQTISRAEAMTILVNAGRVPIPSDVEASQILNQYGDSAQVPQWARRSVAAAVQSGIFINYPSAGYIEPNQFATRAEVAVMANKLQDYLANRGQPLSTPIVSQPQPPGSTLSGSATQQGDLIRGKVAMVPASTVFSAIAVNPISSDRNQVGDQVILTLDRPLLTQAGEIAIPQNSRLVGVITRIEPAGRGEKNAGIDFDFNQIITPDGRTFPLSAEINTEDGILKGGTTKGRVGRIAGRTVGGAAIGGAAGAILGAIKGGGKADDYLARGAAIGGAVGAGSAIISKGNEVVIQPGEGLEVRLRQPLTVTTP